MRAKSQSRFTKVAILTLLVAVVALLAVPNTAYEVMTLTLLYSGDTYGQLESCG